MREEKPLQDALVARRATATFLIISMVKGSVV